MPVSPLVLSVGGRCSGRIAAVLSRMPASPAGSCVAHFITSRLGVVFLFFTIFSVCESGETSENGEKTEELLRLFSLFYRCSGGGSLPWGANRIKGGVSRRR